MLFLKQKADGPLCPQQGHSIYDRRLANGRGGLRISEWRDTEVSVHRITALPLIWFPGHKGPMEGPPGREAPILHTVPHIEMKEMEQNII